MPRRGKGLFLLASVLLLAAALRFAGLSWGFPGRTSFHPDEDKILWQLERMRFAAFDLDPKDFGWGTLHTYVVGAAVAALNRAGAFGGDGWRAAFRERREPQFARLIVAGRALSALFGVATVAGAAALAWQRGGPRAGLCAGALLAVSPLHVAHSHYLTADVALGFWLTAALLVLPRWPVWAGFLLGLAIATKPSAVVLAPLLLLFERRAAGLAALVAGFLVGEPYALVTFQDWAHANLAIAARLGGASPEAFGLTELLGRHLVQIALYGLGPVALVLALVGLARADRTLSLAVLGLSLTLAVSRFPMGRYAVPLLPLLAAAAGLALARLSMPLIAVAALVPPLAYAVVGDAALLRPHPYRQAADFVEARASAGASVARLWEEYPPLRGADHRLLPLDDPFGLAGRAYRPLSADIVVLDDLPLHAWRRELPADLSANYGTAARFGEPLGLPEPWAPHDSRYARPRVSVYERRGRTP